MDNPGIILTNNDFGYEIYGVVSTVNVRGHQVPTIGNCYNLVQVVMFIDTVIRVIGTLDLNKSSTARFLLEALTPHIGRLAGRPVANRVDRTLRDLKYFRATELANRLGVVL